MYQAALIRMQCHGRPLQCNTAGAVENLEESMVFNFGDITYNYQEDAANWWKYRIQGDVPAWMYYVKFEGMSEDEARQMIEEAKKENEPEEPDLFKNE